MIVEADNVLITRQAVRYDRRVTNSGGFLRRTSMDELPQLFDVLFGTLAMVGPRPILPYEVNWLEENLPETASELLRERLEYKPGLTGWAQVNGLRGGPDTIASFERMIEYDLWYMRRRTILKDLRILVSAIARVFVHENAY
jgi:lipopolysaccharide/colanic/teichoic acid biosynthesis glycosyltransferase